MHSYLSGLLGGSLIGLSASTLLLSAGDILGASGIVSSVFLSPLKALREKGQYWKLVLISSFTLPAYLFCAPPTYSDKDNGLASLSPLAFAIGGFFVGFGTKLGNGCTSGHGICGLARFSKRSFVAVGSFMTTGILTAYLTQAATTPFSENSLQFLRNTSGDPVQFYDTAAAVIVMVLAFAALSAPSFHSPNDNDPSDSNKSRKAGPAAAAGFLFSAGLYVSQMVYNSVVFGFLNLGLIPQGAWNPTLIFVMGSGVVVSFLSYQLIEPFRHLKIGRPLAHPVALDAGGEFCVPTNTVIDKQLVLGAACFGLGWGLTGLCPGPAIFLASVGVGPVLVCYWPTFIVGSFLANEIKNRPRRGSSTDTTTRADAKVQSDVQKDLKKPLVTSYGSTEKKS